MRLFKVFCFVLLLTIARAQDDSILQSAAKFIGSCGDQSIMLCIKERALKAIEAATDGNIELTDGVSLVKDETAVEPVTTEEEVLPEEGRAREDAVEERIVDRIAKFLTTYKLEFKLPKKTVEEVNKNVVDEARSRRKKKRGLRRASRILLPILALIQLKTTLLFPLLIGGVALLALKAFIVGKLALILAVIQLIKKLLHKHKHNDIEVIAHPVHHDHGWEHHHDHHDYHPQPDYHGGPYRRSMAANAQDLAYSAYTNTNQQ